MPAGRPTKRDETTEARIAEGLAYGLTNQQCADMVGVDISTFYDWLKIEAFQQRIAGAVAARTLVRLKRVENGDVGWQGCAWLLERTNPGLWARPEIALQFRLQESGGEVRNITTAKEQFLKDLALLTNGKNKDNGAGRPQGI
jgi:hypothetical protein